MSDLFLKTLQDEFAKKPNLKKLSEATVKAIAEAFEGWKEIAAYEPSELVEVFADTETKLTLPQANAIVALAKSESTGEEVKVEVKAEADVPAVVPNQWASLLTADGSLGLKTSSVMATRVNPEVLKKVASGGGLMVLLALGFDNMFDEKFFDRFQIEDEELGGKIYTFNKKRRNGDYFAQTDFERMVKSVPSWFGPNFSTVMETVAKMGGASRANQLIAGGTFNTNEIAQGVSALDVSIPGVAESLADVAVRTDVRFIINDVAQMMRDLMDILRDPKLQAYGGVVGAKDADDGLIKLVKKMMDAKSAQFVANGLRLSVTTEQMILGLGACPAESPLPADYLAVVATLCSRYGALKMMVMPEAEEEEAPEVAQSFRSRSDAVAPSSVREHTRFTFSLGFKFTFRFSRG